MDAHLFRRFCEAFLPDLPGSRLEKIHQPGPGVWVFRLYGFFQGRARKLYLVLKAERKAPLLFVAEHTVSVYAHPPAQVMRLRKHLADKRITAAYPDWARRTLFLQFNHTALWLCLDLREGPSLLFNPPSVSEEPLWPQDDAVLPEEPVSVTRLLADEGWRDWPVLTPALRRTLPFLDEQDALSLLYDLQAGGGDVFGYEDEQGQREVAAWPLPAPVLAPKGRGWKETLWDNPLAALAWYGEQAVFSDLAAKTRHSRIKPFSAEIARLGRLQKKLDQEEERLQALCAGQQDALLLQEQLYRFPAQEKASSVVLETPEGPRERPLNPRLTIRENMAALFHQAGRGKRGLVHLERRKAAVAAEKEAAMEAMLRSAALLQGTGGSVPNSRNAPRAGKDGGSPLKKSAALPKQVQAFRSSDGFLLLRGRDTRGNALALKLAAPHDYWVHTADGPSAHVIIRRDHPGQEVPERTLREAGALAALKSWLKDAERAAIQYSLAKYIHPLKKAAPGMVRIDRSEGTFWTELDPGLEEALRAY